MDDIEKAILISFDESGTVDSLLKSQAVSFCQQIKGTPSICSICIEKLCLSKIVQVQFWCLQCLHEFLCVRYSSMSLEEKSFIRKSVFSMACFEGDNDSVRVLEGPSFIKNKLAQVLVTLIYFEYPLIWSSVFTDFLPNLSKGAVVIDLFCRVLNVLDDELISLDYPRSTEEVAVAGRIKDAMRQQCVPQIVRAWYDIVSMYRNSDHELCTTVLDCVRKYITWIDIGLIVNDAFIRLLFELMLADGLLDQLRAAAAGCVLGVVSKRMDPQAKITLLRNLQLSRVFGLVTENNDSELVSRVASLLTGYATEVLECSKHSNSEDAKGVSMELLHEVLPSVFYAMRSCEVDATFSAVQFLSGYFATMKSLSTMTETQQLHFDPVYRYNLHALDKIGREEEDRMAEFRKDLFVLLCSVGRVAPDVTQIFIRNSLAIAAASSSDRNVEEVEVALSLFFALGESLSDEAMRTGSGEYSIYSPGLAAFLDDRGIHHPNVNVSRRASYLFMRVVKLLKAKLSLQDTVARFTTMNCNSQEFLGLEDGSHIFEAIALLIGMEDVPLEKQSDYLQRCLLLFVS
ncbi:unnamed protein product, partial [Ilex paraguariensis]